MVGLLEDLSQATDQYFKAPGDLIILLGETGPELGGSEYLKVIYGLVKGKIPELDYAREKAVQELCLEAVKEGLVKSAHDCAEGGLAAALFECCLGTKTLGAEVQLESELLPEELLFSESQSRIIISLAEEDLSEFTRLAEQSSASYQIIGRVQEKTLKINNLIEIATEELKAKWKNAIPARLRN